MKAHISSRGSYIIFFVTLVIVCLSVNAVVAHDWMAPKKEAKRINPIKLDQLSINRGKSVYFNDCTMCHGVNLEGMKSEETGLEMDTPNLKQRLTTHTDGDFFWKIQNGRKQTWDVINYIRSESK
ncbi:MAG: hypothetical protein HKP41_17235 [Desulfobacterales bacterium]|nr:hypothetical protein [Desulfobacterales bacterium]